ncbi:MAG: CPBP family intramembrane metalloprotease [Clostridia bacterium]|nr:CPBP family intramembrane metalloprotease [Clostridia bacterium]
MSKLKSGNIASLMLLMWLCVNFAFAFFLPKWVAFAGIISCTLPMLLFKQKYRGKTFGSRDCNTVKYKKKDYALFFVLCISGCAILSAISFLLFSDGTQATTAAHRSQFLYPLVFSCIIPAFFEEWFVRGGILGSFAKYSGLGIYVTALVFAAMHSTAQILYVAFAGILITSLVYVTECIYLGMLLHFLNNFTSLLLSYLSGGAQYIALAVILVAFVISAVLLRKSNLLADIGSVLVTHNKEDGKEVITPFFVIALFLTRFFI